MGEEALQLQALLPLVAAAFTVAPQRHVCRAVTDVVGCHDGPCRFEGSEVSDGVFALDRSAFLVERTSDSWLNSFNVHQHFLQLSNNQHL